MNKSTVGLAEENLLRIYLVSQGFCCRMITVCIALSFNISLFIRCRWLFSSNHSILQFNATRRTTEIVHQIHSLLFGRTVSRVAIQFFKFSIVFFAFSFIQRKLAYQWVHSKHQPDLF